MAESTPIRDRAFPGAAPGEGERVLAPAWRKAKVVFLRSVLWTYERGSWQYDLICLLILAFIFLPGSWFRDRPTLELTNLRHAQGLVEVSHMKNQWTYQVDARLVESLAPMNLEDAVHEILRRRLQKAPIVKSIEPIRDKNNVVLGYAVVVTK